MYEVEQKYRLPHPERFLEKVANVGAFWVKSVTETDTYFQHPMRDFVKTDEAFRIRWHTTTPRGGRPTTETFLTYKGPKLDPTIKTRQERELPLLPFGDEAEFQERWTELLGSLGFRAVRSVHKVREKAYLEWRGFRVELSLDTVESLGRYAELEILVALQEELGRAREEIFALAEVLELTDVEPRSYLDLVISADKIKDTPC
ncbi:MAG: class IV adenylate cyclase [Planctomycetia bacterium]|nr:class IV adenylate cyclase [Planctomycetia bacterium]